MTTIVKGRKDMVVATIMGVILAVRDGLDAISLFSKQIGSIL